MIDDLVQIAKQQPHRVHEAIAEAYRRGRAARSQPPMAAENERRALAARLRRRATVTSEYDGRSHLLDLAAELDPIDSGATSGPKASSASKEGIDHP